MKGRSHFPTDPVGILLMFHCRTNTGFAIGRLERVFHEAARMACPSGPLAYAYSSVDGGYPLHLGESQFPVIECPYFPGAMQSFDALRELLATGGYGTVLAFDMPLRAPVLRQLRLAGVSRVVSYWGAPISSVYPLHLRPFRKLQYWLARGRPDHFVFESQGMLEGALKGAMIPEQAASLLPLGVDTGMFRPDRNDRQTLLERFGIPSDRKVLLYSGHMEPRKGVRILLQMMVELVDRRRRMDVHLVLLGNTHAHRSELEPFLESSVARTHVTFGGYHGDIEMLMRGADIGTIASTGWDSFTMSAVELASSAIPLMVSDLPGLREAVVDGITGLVLPVGDVMAWADAAERLLDDPERRSLLGAAARRRVVADFSVTTQIRTLASLLREHDWSALETLH